MLPQPSKNVKLHGLLLINKPSGPTSHDVIDQLRKITGIRQIGHAGTLDPFASGLLLVGIGEATKLLRHYAGLDKKYEATLKLGATSDTQDRTGKITETPLQSGRQAITPPASLRPPAWPPSASPKACRRATLSVALRAGEALRAGNNQTPKKHQIPITKIKEVLKSFIGKQKQVPPMFSAKKIGGKKLYELARHGQSIKREASDIEVYDIKLISRNSNLVTLNFHVSSGTYIRTLAHDIGQALGCGAYVEELKRTAIGEFKLEDAISVILEAESTRHKLRVSGVMGSSISKMDSIGRPLASLQNDTWQKHLIPLKTVLVSGTFDGLHEGHRNYFQQARQYGQRLIAIIARDKIVEKIKGRKPRYSEKERVAFVKQCDEIDRVYLGVLDNIFDFTASLKPDVIALGYDQTAYTKNLEQEMKNRGLAAAVVRLKPYHPEKYKSSRLNFT